MEGRVGHDQRRARQGVAVEGGGDDLVAVDGVVQGLPEHRVAQHGVALRAGAGVAVEGQLGELPRGGLAGLDARRRRERAELRERHVDGGVDVAQLQVLHHGVGALIGEDVEVGDVRRAAPVVGVGLEMDVLADLPADDLEGPRADDRRLVLKARAGGLARDLRPDVLRQDGHHHAQHVRLGSLRVDLDGVRAGRLGAGDAVGVDGQVREVVLDDVVEGEGHVGGRERHAVLPLHALAGLERPGLAVGRHLPARGQLGPRRQTSWRRSPRGSRSSDARSGSRAPGYR